MPARKHACLFQPASARGQSGAGPPHSKEARCAHCLNGAVSGRPRRDAF